MSENRLLDKRCAKHYISTGVLSPEVFQKHLEALPDLSEKACPIEARLDEEASTENLESAEDSAFAAETLELSDNFEPAVELAVELAENAEPATHFKPIETPALNLLEAAPAEAP